jgi:hypothetical protein
MGSKSRQQHKVRLAPFIPIFHDELESTAYRTLTASAAKLLPYFKRTCVRACKGAPNETTIFGFTYSEAKKYGFTEHTFIRSYKALVLHGFIDLVEQGGLRGAGHSCSKFKLSKRWVAFGGLGWAVDAHKERQKGAG